MMQAASILLRTRVLYSTRHRMAYSCSVRFGSRAVIDTALRQNIRHMLQNVRSMIGSYTGLYGDENLTHDVLHTCDRIIAHVVPHTGLEEARRLVEERCQRLTQMADRFGERNLALISTARAQAIASIDVLQDAVLERCKGYDAAPHVGPVLRVRSS
ncbi:hypothetical protein [Microvirga sp. 2TAF3]|uniref:hypothetical protein n=1 Tax=Microvirga sp. 2TAF3 TaxID=3233014 RepID=UPI003F9872DF